MNSSAENFVSGVTVDDHPLTWTISNFPIILKQRSLVKSQMIDFHGGQNVGRSSLWTAFLFGAEQPHTKKKAAEHKWEDDWVGIGLRLKKAPSVNKTTALYVQFSYTIKSYDEDKIWRHQQSDLLDWSKVDSSGFGFPQMVSCNEAREVPLLTGGLLKVHLNFKIYSPTAPACSDLLKPLRQTLLDEFHARSTAKARRDLGGFHLDEATSGLDDIMTVVSNDGREFPVKKRLLISRSPVFQTMLSTNMIESSLGSITIPDISSKTLPILLTFLYTGELEPGWDHGEILVELTNAAAKYQLFDLLHFLDTALGGVCELQNVGALMILSHQLSLKTAEWELLEFVDSEGLKGPEQLVKILKGVSAVESFSSLDEVVNGGDGKDRSSSSWFRGFWRRGSSKNKGVAAAGARRSKKNGSSAK